MNLSKTYAIVFGVVFSAIGILGFVPGTITDGNLFGLLPVNTLSNVVHLLVGIAGLAAYFSERWSDYAKGMVVVFALMTLGGLVTTFDHTIPLSGVNLLVDAVTALLAGATLWSVRSSSHAHA